MLVEIRKWLTLWWRGEMVGSEKGMGCTDGKRSSGSFPEVQKCSRSYWVMGTWHIQLSKLIDLNTSDLCILWYINYTLWQATSVMIPDSWYSHSYGVTSPGLCTGRSDSLSTNRYSKSEALSLLRWGYKKAVAFRCSLAVLGLACSLLWTAVWRGPHGKELMTLTNSQQELETWQQLHEWVWKQLFPQLSLERKPQSLLVFWL